MTFRNPTVDRVWLCLVALSFVVIVPLYTILMAQRMGWVNLSLVVLALFVIGVYRAWPTDSP